MAAWDQDLDAAPRRQPAWAGDLDRPGTPKIDDPGILRTLPIAAGKTFDSIADGLTQLYLGARGEQSALGGLKTNVDEKAALYKPLQEMHPVATALGEALPAMAIPVGGQAALASMLPRLAAAGAAPGLLEYGSAGERATRGAEGAAGAMVGGTILPKLLGAAGRKAGDMVADRSRAAAEAVAANAPRDAAVAAAQEAGYVLTPSQAGAEGVVNRIAEAVGGKIKTQQAASNRNQVVTNRLARQALGLAEDVPLTPEALRALRTEAGGAYEALRGTGRIVADPQYAQTLDAIGAQYGRAAAAFPGLEKPEIAALVQTLKQPEFDAGAAVDALKVLRSNADDAYRAGNSGLGAASRKAADAMEGAIERHLQDAGDPRLLQDFRKARTTIAKAHTVEKALNPGTGDVSAVKLGQQVAKGKPLTDELRQAGDFGLAFPRAAQSGVDVPAYSIFDAGVGAFGLGSGNPLPAVVAGSRPLLRSLVLSQPYQKAMVKPAAPSGPGPLMRGAPVVLQSDIARRLLQLAGGTGGLALQNGIAP